MYFEHDLRFDEVSWEMITKVETRATTFILLIEIEFRKYENFGRTRLTDLRWVDEMGLI